MSRNTTLGVTMIVGTARFDVEISGLQLPKLEIFAPQPKVTKVSLERTGDGPLSVEFSLADVLDPDEAKDIIGPVIESFLNHLAFNFNISVGEPRLVNLSLPQDASASSTYVATTLDLRRVVTREDVTPDDKQRNELLAAVKQPHKSADLYSAYRFAVNQADDIARFMFLYNIMLQLHGDNQPAVDKHILQKDPSVASAPSPHKPNIVETVFTKLRNEVSHRRQGVDPEETRAGITSNANRLQQLVRSDIAQRS